MPVSSIGVQAPEQQDFDVFMDTLIEENPDVPFFEGEDRSMNCD